MSIETRQIENIVSYRSITQAMDAQSEIMWKRNRYGVDEQEPEFPEVRDSKFDNGTFPGFEK